MNKRNAAFGFTLIELLIAMVIVAILASIAVPSYRSYILRSRRTDAMTALMRLQAAEEKWYLQNNAYTSDLTAAGIGIGAATENNYYTLAVALNAGGQGYMATATPTTTGGQNSDAKCATFTIMHTGQKDATGSAANPREECWR